jgi:hypothetical protein
VRRTCSETYVRGRTIVFNFVEFAQKHVLNGQKTNYGLVSPNKYLGQKPN